MDTKVTARKKLHSLVSENKKFAERVSVGYGGYWHAAGAIDRARGAVELAYKIGLISAKESDELRQSML